MTPARAKMQSQEVERVAVGPSKFQRTHSAAACGQIRS